MPDWTVLFYEDVHGNRPVVEFIDGLSKDERAKALKYLGLLAEMGLKLKPPQAKPLRNHLWELRPSRKCRLIYRAHTGRQFIVLHGVYKRTDEVLERDIATAERRWADFLFRE